MLDPSCENLPFGQTTQGGVPSSEKEPAGQVPVWGGAKNHITSSLGSSGDWERCSHDTERNGGILGGGEGCEGFYPRKSRVTELDISDGRLNRWFFTLLHPSCLFSYRRGRCRRCSRCTPSQRSGRSFDHRQRHRNRLQGLRQK